MKKINFLVPDNIHKLNVFGRYLDYWDKAGLVKINTYKGDLIWLGREGEVLFWPWPQSKHKDSNFDEIIDIHNVKAKHIICTNYFPEQEVTSECIHFSPSFFWGRDPGRLHDSGKKSKDFAARDIRSIFIGKVENSEQSKYRDDIDYSNAIELFYLGRKEDSYPFSQEEYLKRMSSAKFALSLRGFGQKCNREPEALANGCVLMVNSDVDVNSYHEPLVKDRHYKLYETLDDLRAIQMNTTQEEWNYISQNSKAWYERNCSFDGAFTVVESIYEKIRCK